MQGIFFPPKGEELALDFQLNRYGEVMEKQLIKTVRKNGSTFNSVNNIIRRDASYGREGDECWTSQYN